MSIFEKMLSGKSFSISPANFAPAQEVVDRCFRLLHGVNSSTSLAMARERFAELIQKPIDKSVTIFPPIQTNFGKHIFLGKNIVINHGCSFLDMGGIYIEDNVLIAPKVNLLTEGHPLDPSIRSSTLIPGKIVVKEGAWIGAASTVLPGVTVGRNSIVAAGSVVTKNVDDNTIVAGAPARVIKRIPEKPSKL
ncbi:acetyltransferase (isoleucine patch superfamily) [Leptomonas pyrrhocoris]|uniref:Acetyltransferase (Isoleucine patch superfamily) n=1 Tax=Leptomonas pyrrhocoris TaxID=157538 RepID=A0A0M9GB57_LEPPY|nr:acetyltransferase (isoleucine patch superfamily) [Leptomonas pyrrhocoris]KPA86687.1 acetyltransferase (isoleucine patch superfamily) [Leptomonas pyrrhocoris]|eukprot:XP_015665126.1 acetyltransferase (isoleucine patch superfamily) [Leptomonas pyrrhocoris]